MKEREKTKMKRQRDATVQTHFQCYFNIIINQFFTLSFDPKYISSSFHHFLYPFTNLVQLVLTHPKCMQ